VQQPIQLRRSGAPYSNRCTDRFTRLLHVRRSLGRRAKGVEFIRAPEHRDWGLRCVHFKDPDGNVWEIHTRIAEK